MESVKTKLKGSVDVNPEANKFLDIWDPEKWDGVEDEEGATYYEFWDNLLNDEQEYTRELRGNLMQFIDFFYDLYILANEINKNSVPVRERNWVDYLDINTLATLLDDSPKMLFSGGQDFASCKFPEFPNMPKPVETEDLRKKKLIY